MSRCKAVLRSAKAFQSGMLVSCCPGQAVAAAYAAVERVGRSSSSSSGLHRATSSEGKPRSAVPEAKRKLESQVQLARVSLARTKPQVKLPLTDTAPQARASTVPESFWDDEGHVEETTAKARIEPASSSSLPTSNIDVNRLRPRVAQVQSIWKENNPAEWRAMQQQGELVSPQENLLRKRMPGAKRRHEALPAASADAKKARRDDVNESVYQRRQKRWNPSNTASASLVPKQQVDENGVPVCKPDPERKSRANAMPEDIQVCEGLRCPKWLWQALYPYQHRCVHLYPPWDFFGKFLLI